MYGPQTTVPAHMGRPRKPAAWPGSALGLMRCRGWPALVPALSKWRKRIPGLQASPPVLLAAKEARGKGQCDRKEESGADSINGL